MDSKMMSQRLSEHSDRPRSLKSYSTSQTTAVRVYIIMVDVLSNQGNADNRRLRVPWAVFASIPLWFSDRLSVSYHRHPLLGFAN